MNRPRVVIRADGNARIGLGHLSRTLALAEMLAPEFDSVFALANPPEMAISLLAGTFPVIALPELEQEKELDYLLENVLLPADVVILDGYQFGLAYQQKIKAHGCRLVCIDDLNAQPFVADAVVNHAPGVKPEEYQVEPYTRLCFGFDFALLRSPFLAAARHLASGKNPETRNVAHILVTFGGADIHNLSLKIARFCLQFPEVAQVNVVLGSGSSVPESELADSQGKLQLHRNLPAEEMCSLMLRCGALLAPASMVAMEGLATFLSVLCGYYVPAQIPPYQKFKASGCITPVDDWNAVTAPDLRFALANRTNLPHALIDGNQAVRFRELFRSLS